MVKEIEKGFESPLTKLFTRLEELELKVAALEEAVKKPNDPLDLIQKFIPTPAWQPMPIVAVPAPLKCEICSIDFSSSMGYVCVNQGCPRRTTVTYSTGTSFLDAVATDACKASTEVCPCGANTSCQCNK